MTIQRVQSGAGAVRLGEHGHPRAKWTALRAGGCMAETSDLASWPTLHRFMFVGESSA